jgi:hypothetical protein
LLSTVSPLQPEAGAPHAWRGRLLLVQSGRVDGYVGRALVSRKVRLFVPSCGACSHSVQQSA